MVVRCTAARRFWGRRPLCFAGNRSGALHQRAIPSGPFPHESRRIGSKRDWSDELSVSHVFSALRLGSFSENEMRNAFESADSDNSGLVTEDELCHIFKTSGLDKRRAEGSARLLMSRFDQDSDGKLTFDEFRLGVRELVEQHYVSSALAASDNAFADRSLGKRCLTSMNLETYSKDELKEAFQSIDQDRDGMLDFTEIVMLLKKVNMFAEDHHAEKTAATLIRLCDQDGNGRLSFTEFHDGIVGLAKLRDPRIWNLAAAMFATGVAVGASNPCMPLLAQGLSLSQDQFGYTVSALGVSTLMSNMPCATLVDKHGRRPLVIAGLCLQSVSMLGVGLAGSLPQLLAARMLTGAGVSSLGAGASMLVMDMSNPLNRAKTMALSNCAFSGGKVIGPAAGGALIGWIGLTPTFFAIAGTLGAAAIYSRCAIQESLMGSYDKSVPVKTTLTHMMAQWRELSHNPQLRSLMLLNFTSIAAHAGNCYTLLPLMLVSDQFSLSPVQIGTVFSLQAGASVLAAGPAGTLIDYLGAERLMAPTLIGTSLAMAAFPFALFRNKKNCNLEISIGGGLIA